MPNGAASSLVSERPPSGLQGADPVPVRVAIGRLSAIERAIIEAVCYGDVFDWPLTPAEVHRYLPVAAGRDQVDAALGSASLRALLHRTAGFVGLAGRSSLARRRLTREAESARRWPRALRAARAVAALPFVRLVAITGSLAVSAATPRSDVDLFVVTEDGRLWLTRALAISVVRVAGGAGVTLCPNYFVAESALALPERDLFTAHELMQMLPIAGHATYHDLLARNGWVRDVLPNATPRRLSAATRSGRRHASLEHVLRARPIDRLERWEMERKIASWTSAGSGVGELRFGATACKGHFEGHRERALTAFRERLARFDEGAE